MTEKVGNQLTYLINGQRERTWIREQTHAQLRHAFARLHSNSANNQFPFEIGIRALYPEGRHPGDTRIFGTLTINKYRSPGIRVERRGKYMALNEFSKLITENIEREFWIRVRQLLRHRKYSEAVQLKWNVGRGVILQDDGKRKYIGGPLQVQLDITIERPAKRLIVLDHSRRNRLTFPSAVVENESVKDVFEKMKAQHRNVEVISFMSAEQNALIEEILGQPVACNYAEPVGFEINSFCGDRVCTIKFDYIDRLVTEYAERFGWTVADCILGKHQDIFFDTAGYDKVAASYWGSW